jgi:hypothetical protein
MSDFRFELTAEEKTYLRDLVQQSITSWFDPDKTASEPPKPPTEKLREHFGAFVTLKLSGNLRGCIGNVRGTGELFRTVWNMARAAAFEDPRFPSLTEDEFKALDYEISILSPIDTCPDPKQIETGRHGLIISRGGQSGLLLPQVATEWKWDRTTFLAQTCVKAGLERDTWKKPGTTILWFEAVVF